MRGNLSDDPGENVWVLVLACPLTNAACTPRGWGGGGKRLGIFESISLVVKDTCPFSCKNKLVKDTCNTCPHYLKGWGFGVQRKPCI